jgi:hypothetical protein
MSNIFISYAHWTGRQARAAGDALRAAGYTVWPDDDLPAHRRFGSQIEVQLTAAKAALAIWSAVETDRVLSEANRAREDRKLDGVRLRENREALLARLSEAELATLMAEAVQLTPEQQFVLATKLDG